MKCKNCGKEFKPIREDHQFCSQKCCDSFYYRKAHPPLQKTCSVCGKPFVTRNKKSACCCGACRNEKRTLTNSRGKNRAFTDITPYLCQKWHREGTPISQIADTLNRSIQSVKQALAVPLTKEAYADMREYAK